MKIRGILIAVVLGFGGGYLAAPRKEAAPVPSMAPRPPTATEEGRPLAGYFKDAVALLVSYKPGEAARKTMAITLAPGEGEILEKALAADLAAGPLEGRLTYPDQYAIAVAGPSGMVSYEYEATAGAARISMQDGPRSRLLGSATFSAELLKLIHLRARQ